MMMRMILALVVLTGCTTHAAPMPDAPAPEVDALGADVPADACVTGFPGDRCCNGQCAAGYVCGENGVCR
jgi:hypothetical protein